MHNLDSEQLERLARYFNEEVTFSQHIGAKVENVEPGCATCYIDVEDVHKNGTGTLHGGVYASLIDNAMGLAVLALVGVRTATIEMNVHFLGAVTEGRITCRSEWSTAPAAPPQPRRRSTTPRTTWWPWARGRSASSIRRGTP